MNVFDEGCLVCGKPLVYFLFEKEMTCHGCGSVRSANAACEDGHFICDSCHEEPGFVFITRFAAETKSKNPLSIAAEIMRDSSVTMHGPEHHYLVPAVLLAAYRNSGGDIDLAKTLVTAAQRAKIVPGGICGTCGSCGAGIGSGIFVSVVTGANCMSEQSWSLANRMTSKSLAAIAEHGGPRCCKRDSFLAITEAVAFAKERFAVAMEMPESLVCPFSHRNKQCRKDKCLYHPAYSPR
jgi:hypothetical protein